MPRVKHPREKYLQRQRVAFMLAQETVFPDKRDLRKALGCTPSMLKNYATGSAILPELVLYNATLENADMETFAEVYIKHLWSVKG